MSDESRIWLPYCGAGSNPADWAGRWNLDPILIGLIVTLLLAGLVWARTKAQSQLAAAVLVAILFVSPLCALGSALFAFRAFHHLVLALILAPMLVSAIGVSTSRLSISLAIATAVQAGVFWAWHVPNFYEAALTNNALFWTMQVSITGSAMVWWIALRNASPLAVTASLLATMVQMGLLGALIVFAGRPLYAPHWLTTASWGLSPIEDQQIAGMLMWVLGGGVYLLLAAVLLYRGLASRTAPRAA